MSHKGVVGEKLQEEKFDTKELLARVKSLKEIGDGTLKILQEIYDEKIKKKKMLKEGNMLPTNRHTAQAKVSTTRQRNG